MKATDDVLIYIHIPGPEATLIWDGLAIGRHEQRYRPAKRFCCMQKTCAEKIVVPAAGKHFPRLAAPNEFLSGKWGF